MSKHSHFVNRVTCILIIKCFLIFSLFSVNAENLNDSVNAVSFELMLSEDRSEILSDEERAFITQQQIVRFAGDPDWRPFEYDGIDGEHQGIISDYLKIVAARAGFKLSKVPTKTWDKTLEKARDMQIDLIPGITQTDEKQQYLRFSVLDV